MAKTRSLKKTNPKRPDFRKLVQRFSSPMVNVFMSLILSSFVAGSTYLLFEVNNDLRKSQLEQEALANLDELDLALDQDMAQFYTNVGELNRLLSVSDSIWETLQNNLGNDELPLGFVSESKLDIDNSLEALHEKQGTAKGEIFDHPSMVLLNQHYLDLINVTISRFRLLRSFIINWSALSKVEHEIEAYNLVDIEHQTISAVAGLQLAQSQVKVDEDSAQSARQDREAQLVQLNDEMALRKTLSIAQIIVALALLGLVLGNLIQKLRESK